MTRGRERTRLDEVTVAAAGRLVAMVPAGTCTDRAILKWQFRMVLPTRFLPNRYEHVPN